MESRHYTLDTSQCTPQCCFNKCEILFSLFDYFYTQNCLCWLSLDASAICSCLAGLCPPTSQKNTLGKTRGRVGMVRTEDIHWVTLDQEAELPGQMGRGFVFLSLALPPSCVLVEHKQMQAGPVSSSRVWQGCHLFLGPCQEPGGVQSPTVIQPSLIGCLVQIAQFWKTLKAAARACSSWRSHWTSQTALVLHTWGPLPT